MKTRRAPARWNPRRWTRRGGARRTPSWTANLADIRQALTPYSRRLLELWHDSPDDPRAKNPAWVSKAQKEFGISREQVMADFKEMTDTLRARVNKKGLTRDDFTRISGARGCRTRTNRLDKRAQICIVI